MLAVWLRCCLPVSRRSPCRPCRPLASPRAAVPVCCGQGGTRGSGWASGPTARGLGGGSQPILQLLEGRSATGESCVGRSLAAPAVPHRNAPGLLGVPRHEEFGQPRSAAAVSVLVPEGAVGALRQSRRR